MKDKVLMMNLKKMWYISNIEKKEYTISNFIKKKSTSIVKKIFFVSIFECILTILCGFIFKQIKFTADIEKLDSNYIVVFFESITYFILFYFAVLFYKNYKRIDSSSSLKNLNQNILKTRNSVYNYVYTSIIYFNIQTIIVSFIYLNNYSTLQLNEPNFFYLMFFLILIIILSLFSLFIWKIYKYFYFKLVDKLSLDLKELNEIDL